MHDVQYARTHVPPHYRAYATFRLPPLPTPPLSAAHHFFAFHRPPFFLIESFHPPEIIVADDCFRSLQGGDVLQLVAFVGAAPARSPNLLGAAEEVRICSNVIFSQYDVATFAICICSNVFVLWLISPQILGKCRDIILRKNGACPGHPREAGGGRASASGTPSGAARARRLQARVAISSSAQKPSHLQRG